MDKGTTLDRMRAGGIIAVLRSPSYQAALDTTAALLAAGLVGIEITFSTPDALKVARALRDRHGDDIVLGMGTLTDPAQVAASRDAGAEFLVSPHIDAELAAAMAASGLAAVIGALTPSEVVQALKRGADVVKIFPGSLVGPGYLKALRGPFGEIPLMPTGGVTPENVPQWFAAGAFAVAAGGSLCPADLVQRGEFAEITRRAAQFVAAVARVKKERDG
jgi:2-dehydro-3-deoxyphosphogluconate aldolase/(4S)-4-hydroxy-2-oxoglutarate aldolase